MKFLKPNPHNSLSEEKYQVLLKEIFNKWKKDPELQAFHGYILRQWVNSSFKLIKLWKN